MSLLDKRQLTKLIRSLFLFIVLFLFLGLYESIIVTLAQLYKKWKYDEITPR